MGDSSKGISFGVVLRSISCSVAIVSTLFVPAQVVLAQSYNLDYTENDVQTYDPSDGQCSNASSTSTTSTGTAGTVTGFNPDPQAVKIFNSDIKPQLAKFVPLYQEAAKDEGLNDWAILAGIHYREHFSMTNPDNSDGIFQTQTHYADPAIYAPGLTLSNAQFVEQARAAIKYYVIPFAKDRGVDPTKPLTPDGAAQIAFAYNSGPAYASDYHRSTYAWAGFDSAKYKLPMTGFVGHIDPYVDNRPGAATIWGLVRGGQFASGSTQCDNTTGSIPGDNVVYYSQHDPRWAQEHFPCGGDCGTFSAEGCYLTDLAMIASTFKHQNIYPDKVAAKDGGNVDIGPFAAEYGLSMTPLSNIDQAIAALDAKKVVLIHGNYGPIDLVANHWVVLRGYVKGTKADHSDDKFLINDPYDSTDLSKTPKEGPSVLNMTPIAVFSYQKRPFTTKQWTRQDISNPTDAWYSFGLPPGNVK